MSQEEIPPPKEPSTTKLTAWGLGICPYDTAYLVKRFPRQGEKIDLRILYAGEPGSEREREFLGFLREHFVEVGEADLRKFGESQAKGFDVVILDWDGKDLRAPRPRLPQNYARATVTLGVPGAMICGNLGLKSGYL